MAERDIKEQLLDELVCKRCNKTLENPVTLPCGHVFCDVERGKRVKSCVQQIKLHDNVYMCPVCASVQSCENDLPKAEVIDNILKIVHTSSSRGTPKKIDEHKHEDPGIEYSCLVISDIRLAPGAWDDFKIRNPILDRFIKIGRDQTICSLSNLSAQGFWAASLRVEDNICKIQLDRKLSINFKFVSRGQKFSFFSGKLSKSSKYIIEKENLAIDLPTTTEFEADKWMQIIFSRRIDSSHEIIQLEKLGDFYFILTKHTTVERKQKEEFETSSSYIIICSFDEGRMKSITTLSHVDDLPCSAMTSFVVLKRRPIDGQSSANDYLIASQFESDSYWICVFIWRSSVPDVHKSYRRRLPVKAYEFLGVDEKHHGLIIRSAQSSICKLSLVHWKNLLPHKFESSRT